MTEMLRCFVAVPIDDAIRAALSDSVAAWRHEPPVDALRWADSSGWHLTLAFLGGLESEDVAACTHALRAVAAVHRPTEIVTSRLGAFPRLSSARVLWYGVADPDGALVAIADALGSALHLPSDGPFQAHISLARARRRPVDLSGWIENASAAAPEGRLRVESLHLIRSHLGAGPARYETLASLPLGGHAQ
jgi:2'-5' RNA ligase